MKYSHILLCALSILAGCTTSRLVRTIGKGNAAIETSFGGPVFRNLGAPVPAPNLYIGGRYGVREDLDLTLNYNLTGPIIPGIGLDTILTAVYVPIQPGIGNQGAFKTAGWSLGTATSLHLISNFKDGAIVIPSTDIAFGWRYKWFNPFIGVSFALHFFRPYGKISPLFLSPLLGSDFIISNKTVSLKLAFLDVTYNMYGSQLEWVHLINRDFKHKYGMLTILIGFSYDFIDIFGKHSKKSQG